MTLSPCPATKKPSFSSVRRSSGSSTSTPDSRCTVSSGKSMMRSGMSCAPATVVSDGPRRRDSSTMAGKLEARHQEGRVDAALEPVARVRVDAELAAGLRDVELVPKRRFDQHVGGGSEQPVASPPMMPAKTSALAHPRSRTSSRRAG